MASPKHKYFRQTLHFLDRALKVKVKADGFARQSVRTAWEIGDCLNAAKHFCPHGQWLPALYDAGFNRGTAARLMKLNQGITLALTERFDDVRQAIEFIRSN